MKQAIRTFAVALAAGAMLASCTVTQPVAVTSNPVGNKCGEATTTLIMGIGGANNGINKAVKNGGITRISHVDYSQFTVLGVYTKMTTRVYGE